ncbi:hypothetical protein BDZ88DRAFT_437764 [Geranomyces variabilis]|nr:hypothetical protein BDZ88DRAFT_437764 [Geranomyces variabilis]
MSKPTPSGCGGGNTPLQTAAATAGIVMHGSLVKMAVHCGVYGGKSGVVLFATAGAAGAAGAGRVVAACAATVAGRDFLGKQNGAFLQSVSPTPISANART